MVCCRWNRLLQAPADSRLESDPSPANPIVFHLHGEIGRPDSLVLTEDDYLDFLIRISRDQDLLPPRIRQAFADASLLFLGYRIADWDFRVLWRMLVVYLETSLKRKHISVQYVPLEENATEEQKRLAAEYLDRYFGEQNIRVFWGNCREFTAELLREHLRQAREYEAAYRAWRAEKPLKLKGAYPKRDELYDRPVLRRR